MATALKGSSAQAALASLEAEIRSSVRAEDFDRSQMLLQQYRDRIEQLVRSAIHPQAECASLGARAKDLYGWIRQMTLIGRAKYLSRLQAVRQTSAYSSRGGEAAEAKFQVKA